MHELQVYCAAIKLPNQERELFIQAACVKNPQLLERVRALFNAKSNPAVPDPLPDCHSIDRAIVIRMVGDVLVAHFADVWILDEKRICEIGVELLRLVPRCTGHKMVLNFLSVTLMSSALVGKILGLHNECTKAHVVLRLCNIASNIMQVFSVMKLTAVLNIDKTEPKSLAAFDKHGFFGLSKRAVN